MMHVLISALGYILAILIMVVVHELGHYWVARWCGVKIIRFSVGFGPVIAERVDKHGTVWALAWLPLGGYVKMLDERELGYEVQDLAPEEQSRSFNRQSVAKRIAIAAAGPVANLLLAWVIMVGMAMHGLESLRPELGTVVRASPAAQAGLQAGDVITRLDRQAIQSWDDMQWVLLEKTLDHPQVHVELLRQGQPLTRTLPLLQNPESRDEKLLARLGLLPIRLSTVLERVEAKSPAAQAGMQAGDQIRRINGVLIDNWEQVHASISTLPARAQLSVEVLRAGKVLSMQVRPTQVREQGRLVSRIGIAPSLDAAAFQRQVFIQRFALGPAMVKSWRMAEDYVRLSIKMIRALLVRDVSHKTVGGIFTMADQVGRAAEGGFGYYLRALALLSLGLAVMNLLPIPVLDGGHIVYGLLEWVHRGLGWLLSETGMQWAQRLGGAIIMALIGLALFNDFFHRLGAG